MAADPIIYCLEQLSDYTQFERLCHDLMFASGFDKIEPLGGFHDKGRDAIHKSVSSGQTSIFAYSVREDWRKKLREDAGKIHYNQHLCDELIFITTADIAANERDAAVKDIASEFGWPLQLYGLERLRILLTGKNQPLIGKHPQIFHPSFFPASVGSKLRVSVNSTQNRGRQMVQFQLFNAGTQPIFISTWFAQWGPLTPRYRTSRDCASGQLPKRLQQQDAYDFLVYLDDQPIEQLEKIGVDDGSANQWKATDENVQALIRTAIAHRLPELLEVSRADSDFEHCRVEIQAVAHPADSREDPNLEIVFKNHGPKSIPLRGARISWRYDPPMNLSMSERGPQVLETEGEFSIAPPNPRMIVQPGGECRFQIGPDCAQIMVGLLSKNVADKDISIVVMGGQLLIWEERNPALIKILKDFARSVVASWGNK